MFHIFIYLCVMKFNSHKIVIELDERSGSYLISVKSSLSPVPLHMFNDRFKCVDYIKFLIFKKFQLCQMKMKKEDSLLF